MTLDQARAQGILILDEVPDGWTEIKGAATAPSGYRWYSNGRSRFTAFGGGPGVRRSALIREVTG